MTNSIIDAITEIDPPPCETCPQYRFCAEHYAACWRFLVYAEGNHNRARVRVNNWRYQVYENPDPRVREPTTPIYRMIYADEDRPRAGRPRKQ